ncbi:hypothetical protein DFS34DRAFT_596265 [Phlyctochytrium arcticum]|nr:hypothetical protein DFS34DRAFT_596265 [Phlyctochytrium arcticum]
MVKPKQFRPAPGTFCKAMVSIPSEIATASYSQHTRSQTDCRLESRLVYVHSRAGTVYSVYFCTTFDNRDINTQVSDHPHKRNFFIPLHPTQRFNDHDAVRTKDGWDRRPSYLCLYPSVEVVVESTLPANKPVPELEDGERQRLDDLIANMADAAEEDDDGDDVDADPNGEGSKDVDGSDILSSRPSSTTTNTYEQDFPALPGLKSEGSGGWHGRYSRAGNIRNWALEVAGIPLSSQEAEVANGDVQRLGRPDDDWSQVSGFSPADFARARMGSKVLPRVIFSDNLSGIRMDEADPARVFMKEAQAFNAVVVI